MSLIPTKCIDPNEDWKVCSVREKGISYQLENSFSYKITKVKVDGCLLQKEGERRCDYLFVIHQIESVIFIELKGNSSKIKDALEQLYQTIIFLKNEFENYIFHARIAGSKGIPDIENLPEYKKLARQIIPTKGTIKKEVKEKIENFQN